ncbi:hypothetical protein OSTOST_09975 [Ostertagia ostertagi]
MTNAVVLVFIRLNALRPVCIAVHTGCNALKRFLYHSNLNKCFNDNDHLFNRSIAVDSNKTRRQSDVASPDCKVDGKYIIEKYYVPYTTTHIFSATLFTLVMGAFAFDNRTADLMVTCIITMAIRGVAHHDSTRQIHRSLLVISSTMVFGWVSAMILQMVTKIPGLHFERLHVDLLAGIFVTSASASNFFVYYTISKKYRNLFDKYLFIRRFKKGFTLSCAPNATVDVLILANRIKENPQV